MSALAVEELVEAPGRPTSWNPSWGPGPLWATERTPERPTYGPIVARAAELLGRPLFPSQRYIADVLGEVQSAAAGDPEPGRLAYDQGQALMPRRSGKTVLVQPMVARTCGGPAKKTAWTTAQKRDSAVRRWRDATDQILASPMAGMVRRKISIAHEELRWTKTESLYVPVAPDDESMHGEDPDLAIVDEVWALSVAELHAIQDGYRPAWSVKEGQELLLSAAGVLRSGALKHQRLLGRESVHRGRRLGLAHFEWAVPPVVGGVAVEELPDPELVDVVWASHPRRHHGLERSFLVGELAKGRARFLRHYGGVDDDSGQTAAAIDLGKVTAAAAVEPVPADARVVLVFDADPDGLEASLASGWVWPDGVVQIEAVERQQGLRWAGPRVVQIVEEQPVGLVACVNVGPARDLADEIEPRLPEGVSMLRLPGADYGASCMRLKTSIEQQQPPELVRVRLHDPRGEFADAVQHAGVARWRSGPVWVKASEQPISMLPAFSVALWAADRVPAAPAPRPRFKVG